MVLETQADTRREKVSIHETTVTLTPVNFLLSVEDPQSPAARELIQLLRPHRLREGVCHHALRGDPFHHRRSGVGQLL